MKNYLTILLFISSTSSAQSLLTVPVKKWDEAKSNLITLEDKRFFIQSSASINFQENPSSSLEASETLIFTYRPSIKENGYFKTKPGVDLAFGLNLLNLNPQGENKDSIDLASLMFPETGNFGLLLSGSVCWGLKSENKRYYSWSSEFTMSLRQTKVDNIPVFDNNGTFIDSETLDFSVLNYNATIAKFSFFYQPEEDKNAQFHVGVYGNLFNIANEDVATFNRLFPKENPVFQSVDKSYIIGVGCKISASYNNFILFTDLRQNLKTAGLADDNPYKGFIFNAGIAHGLNLTSM
jgi:hypothetical protein